MCSDVIASAAVGSCKADCCPFQLIPARGKRASSRSAWLPKRLPECRSRCNKPFVSCPSLTESGFRLGCSLRIRKRKEHMLGRNVVVTNALCFVTRGGGVGMECL
jgi:hypothetical protein